MHGTELAIQNHDCYICIRIDQHSGTPKMLPELPLPGQVSLQKRPLSYTGHLFGFKCYVYVIHL